MNQETTKENTIHNENRPNSIHRLNECGRKQGTGGTNQLTVTMGTNETRTKHGIKLKSNGKPQTR